MESTGYYSLQGSGDLQKYDGQPRSARDIPSYVKKKLSNGLPIPVFPQGEDENGNIEDEFFNINASKRESRTPTSSKGLSGRKSVPELIKEHLSCPLCRDPIIEATSTNCGHKFCKDCLDKWRKQKSVCPVCSSWISYTHRVYSDDQMIESQLENFSSDVQIRFLSAQRKRLNAMLEQRKSKTVGKRIHQKWDEFVTYFRTKNWKTFQAAMVFKVGQFWKLLCDLASNYNVGLFIAFMLGAMVMFGLNQVQESNFLRYVYLAVKNYNGTIPFEGVEGKGLREIVKASPIEMLLLHYIYPWRYFQ